MSQKITVWILTAKFPNTLQRWLANIAAQIPKYGGDVQMFSMKKGDRNYSEIVDEYQLDQKTVHLDIEGIRKLKKIVSNFLNPLTTLQTFRGLIASAEFGSPHKSKLNNLISRMVLAPYLIPHKVDIIHSHSEPAGYKLLPIIKAQGVPFVITFHGMQPPGVTELPRPLRKEYTQQADIILVNTEFSKKQYSHLGADSSKIRILPQGTNTRKFQFKAKEFPKDGVVKVLTVARFHSEKGQEYAIRAVAGLIKSGYKLNYTLVGEGPDRDRLMSLATELDIHHFVQFKSALSEDEIIVEYQANHVFILPSLGADDGLHEETQGVVIQEAQACGAIVIATQTGGIPECVDYGKQGFLVKDKSAELIAERLRYIIDNNQNWHQWQTSARTWVEENYDIDVIGKRMMSMYAELMQGDAQNVERHR